jgi:hypothetical protein
MKICVYIHSITVFINQRQSEQFFMHLKATFSRPKTRVALKQKAQEELKVKGSELGGKLWAKVKGAQREII